MEKKKIQRTLTKEIKMPTTREFIVKRDEESFHTITNSVDIAYQILLRSELLTSFLLKVYEDTYGKIIPNGTSIPKEFSIPIKEEFPPIVLLGNMDIPTAQKQTKFSTPGESRLIYDDLIAINLKNPRLVINRHEITLQGDIISLQSDADDNFETYKETKKEHLIELGKFTSGDFEARLYMINLNYLLDHRHFEILTRAVEDYLSENPV